jgi:hypothetical protein
MKYRAAITILLVLIIWLASSLVRVENERTALLVGLCRDKATGLTDVPCLSKVETRTSWAWHLLYGMGIL